MQRLTKQAKKFYGSNYNPGSLYPPKDTKFFLNEEYIPFDFDTDKLLSKVCIKNKVLGWANTSINLSVNRATAILPGSSSTLYYRYNILNI